MGGRRRLRLYAAGAVLTAGALWACWWWLSSEYSPLLDNPPSARPPARPAPRVAAAVPAAAKPRPLPTDPAALMKRLSVGADQPGIVVCEPVVRGADPTTARFSSGCSRWLSFALGGVPALGSTPSWDTIATVLPTIGLRDLRMTGEQARQLARPLGVPYAAVGEISGTAARASLTYRLYEIPSGKPKGSPVTVTGPLEAITGKLPEVTAAMLRAANVPETRVGEGLTETASTLTALGAYSWRAEASVPKELEKLCYRSQLARLVLLTRADVWDLPQTPRIQQELVEKFPDHPLALQMATLCVDLKPEQRTGSLLTLIKNGEEIRRQYPFSCLTQMALTTAYWRNGQPEDARDAAEAAVVSCNRSAEAWCQLATVTDALAANAASSANQAALANAMARLNAMRQGAAGGGRPAVLPGLPRGGTSAARSAAPTLPGGRSPDQDAWYRGILLRRQVGPLFRKALALDSRRWDIWRNYCGAASRDNDWTAASAAFWKAAPLCGGDADTINAGLDLWSQWHPQTQEFHRVVEFALAHPSSSVFQRERLSTYFGERGLGAEARRILPNETLFPGLPVAVTRRIPQMAPGKAPLVAPIKTPPPADLAQQKIAGPWLIGKPGGQLTRLTWSPDGSVLAAADGWPGPVVWKGGAAVQRLGGAPQASMHDVAWTGSGELVGAVEDGRLVYWNAVSGQVLRTVPRPRGTNARTIIIRPSGDRIVYRDEQRMFSLFSMPDQRRLQMRAAATGYPSETRTVSDAAFSPDGSQLATVVNAGSGAILLLRSAEDGHELRRIEPPGNAEGVAWRPDSKAVAVSVSDNTVRVYGLDGNELAIRHVRYRPRCMAWGPGGKLLAFSAGDVFQTWNPASGELRESPRGHENGVQLLAWDLLGDRIATWGYDRSLLLWNPNALAPARAFPEAPTAETVVLSPWQNFTLPERTSLGQLTFTPDSQTLTAASNAEADLYDLSSGRPVQHFRPTGSGTLQRIFLTPDWKTVLAIGFNEVSARDCTTGAVRWEHKRTRNLLGTGLYSNGVGAVSPDGRWLATALADGDDLHLWNPATGEDARQLPVCGTPYVVQFSPDGKWLAVAYGSGSRWADIDLYDARTFKLAGTLSGHRAEIRSLCFSRDGSMLASLSADRTARLWDVVSRKQVRLLPADVGQFGTVAFLSDGRRLFVQSGSQVRTWEIPSGKLLKDLQLKRENTSPLTLSPDGKLAASQVMNNIREQKRSVQVWRVAE